MFDRMRRANPILRVRSLPVLLLFGLATVGCGSSTPRIDATTEESFDASLKAMKAGMTPAEASLLSRYVDGYTLIVQPKYQGKYIEKARASGKNAAGLDRPELLALIHEIHSSLHGLTAPEIKQKAEAAEREMQKRLKER